MEEKMNNTKNITKRMMSKQKTMLGVISNAIKNNIKTSALVLGLMGFPMFSSMAEGINLEGNNMTASSSFEQNNLTNAKTEQGPVLGDAFLKALPVKESRAISDILNEEEALKNMNVGSINLMQINDILSRRNTNKDVKNKFITVASGLKRNTLRNSLENISKTYSADSEVIKKVNEAFIKTGIVVNYVLSNDIADLSIIDKVYKNMTNILDLLKDGSGDEQMKPFIQPELEKIENNLSQLSEQESNENVSQLSKRQSSLNMFVNILAKAIDKYNR